MKKIPNGRSRLQQGQIGSPCPQIDRGEKVSMIGPKEKIFTRVDPEFWPGRPKIGQILGFWAPLATRGRGATRPWAAL